MNVMTHNTMEVSLLSEKPGFYQSIRQGKIMSDENALLQRHISGDDSAFIQLFHQLNKKVFLYCMKLLGNASLAEDITQELWEMVVRLRVSPMVVENPKSYLFRAARNMCMNELKRRHRTSLFSILKESNQPVTSPGNRSELEESVLSAVQSLPFAYREVIILHSYCGYSIAEIANMLNISMETAWKRSSRARKKLRKLISGTRTSLDNYDNDISIE